MELGDELRETLELPACHRRGGEPDQVVHLVDRGEEPELGESSEGAAHHPVLADAVVLTTDAGAALLGDAVPKVVAVNDGGWVDLRAALAWLRAQGHAQILAEAGPTTFGGLVAAELVDELFLTVSPVLAGRSAAGRRLGLVEGTALLPETRVAPTLLSVRRGSEHLFLRYGFRV